MVLLLYVIVTYFFVSELTEKVEAGSSVDFMNEYAQKLLYGSFPVRTLDIVKPDDSIRARTVDAKHVATLVESFLAWNSTPDDVQLLVLVKLGVPGPNKHIKTIDSIPSKRGFDFQEWYPTLKHYGFQVICGDHSVSALKSIIHRYADVEKWQTLQCKVYIGVADNPEVIRFAHLWGTSDNVKKAVQRRVSVFEQLVETHRLFFSHPQILSYINNPDAKKRDPAWVTQFKQDRMLALGLNKGIWGQTWVLVTMTGQKWDLIESIFKGYVGGKTDNAPSSICHFIWMSGVPDDLLITWLNDVIIGRMSTQQFSGKCIAYKARLFIRTAILKRLSLHFKRELNDWDKAASVYRHVTDNNWIESFVPSLCNGKKRVLSSYFMDQMEERLAADLDALAQKIKVKQQVHHVI